MGMTVMRRGGGMVAAALLAALSAQAQPARPPAPAAAPAPVPGQAPGPEAPERTSATFGDWSVQCVRAAARLCEMTQTTQDQRQQPVAVLALGRVARAEPLKLVARVPVNVLVGTPLRLSFEGGEAPLAMPFRACSLNPVGCFAELELKDEALLKRLRGRAADQPGRLDWRDPAGAEVAIPVSFRGFGAALEALLREPG